MKLVSIAEKLSYVPLKIEMAYNNVKLSIGTAFLYSYKDKSYLITNWHNVTGRNIDNKLLLIPSYIPNKLMCYIPIKEKINDNKTIIKWNSITINLYNDNEFKSPAWYEYPGENNLVDVVAIEFKPDESMKCLPANSKSLELNELNLYPGMEVFVLGYPRGMSGGGKFPIWKRGSLATEPDIDIENLPLMYIDTATREGMSGSPVYVHEIGYWIPKGKTQEDACFGRTDMFLGVYSGRVGDDSFLAQLGKVWKEQCIINIIEKQHKGKSSFSYS